MTDYAQSRKSGDGTSMKKRRKEVVTVRRPCVVSRSLNRGSSLESEKMGRRTADYVRAL